MPATLTPTQRWREAVVRPARKHFAVMTTLTSSLALVVWTWLALHTRLLARLDHWSDRPHLVHDGPAAQVWSAISIVTMPTVMAVSLLLVSGWAWRRRMRNLAWAVVLAVAITWLGSHLLKAVFHRTRPASPLADLITYRGLSYPSGHAAMATTAAAMLIATMTTSRQRPDVRYLWNTLCVAGVLVVGWDRLVTNAHYPTDVVAGILLGLFGSGLACLLCRVHMLPVPASLAARATQRTCAVIWNPSKVLDVNHFLRTIEWEVGARGWQPPLWLQTRVDDPGVRMARAAIAAKVDRVVVAGGDGTVRVVCSELAGTGIEVAIIPAGTGNLLARNLGIPLDEVAAARMAFAAKASPIDLVRVTIDDERDRQTHFAVMAGIGIDAKIMDNTNPELKRTVGSAAYFLSAAQQVRTPPMDLTFQVDDGEPQQRNAILALVGNVGLLQGNIPMFPNADPADGLLDFVVASPERLRQWGPMTARYLTGRGRPVDGIDQLTGRKVTVTVAEQLPYELDGDTEGRATTFEAEVAPGALLLVH